MAETMTLEQIELLTAQLPPTQQLRLVAQIGQRLSTAELPILPPPANATQHRLENEADALLARMDEAAAMWEGDFDSAESIRQMRAERGQELCPSR